MEYVVNVIDCPDDVDEEVISTIARNVLAAINHDACELSIAFFDDEYLRYLNKEYRGKDKATDILSFPFVQDEGDEDDEEENYLGDIAISEESAIAQAREFGHDLQTEMAYLTIHGVLHLTGMDHESDQGQMDSLELELRDKLFPANRE